MNTQEKFEKILSIYEDLKLHRGTLEGKEGAFDFQAPSSIHSNITSFAYGIREVRSCYSLERYPCVSRVSLSESDIRRRFYIKLKACLFDWEKYVTPIIITVGGALAYMNSRELFENVNLGWPTVYIPIDSSLLSAGENVIEIRQVGGSTPLLVTTLDLLSLPEIKEGDQLTARRSARLGDRVSLSFYAPSGNVRPALMKHCSVLDIKQSPIDCDHVIVILKITGMSPALELTIGNESVKVTMPEIFPASDDVCLVGTDSDDHRHDDSDETDRILEIFENTSLGNFCQARPQKHRNYEYLSDRSIWEMRVDYLRSFGTKLSLADSDNVMPYFSDLAGEDFVGKHFHEAYLFFCSALTYSEKLSAMFFLDPEKLRSSESFGESRRMFEDALKKMYLSCSAEAGATSVGSPSLLTVYESRCGFERVTIEPVSNISLLIGAVRGAEPKMWGAHVPTDWYFGEPNDLTKARKFLLAMQLLYMNGADYIYAENSLFKTNAFSRTDWEDSFPTYCRRFLRDFYDYTIREPRESDPAVDLCVLYGNNEYFMWHYDDRIAELPENDDWDITVWGKWREAQHIKCWRAVDAWLPLASEQNTRENVLNLKLFSGTPYGSVDVAPYDSDISKYKALALLGWNTYEDGFAERIRDYVSEGGVAFLSYCHLNRTDRSDMPKEYAEPTVFGIECDGVYPYDKSLIDREGRTMRLSEEISLAKCRAEGAEILARAENGDPLLLKLKIGLGTLYFATFADYNCPDARREIMMDALREIGEAVAEVRCSNKNISFTRRRNASGGTTLHLLNVNANSDTPDSYELTFKDGRRFSGELEPCKILKIES